MSDVLGGSSSPRREIGEGFQYLIVDESIRHGRSHWSRTSPMTPSPPWGTSGRPSVRCLTQRRPDAVIGVRGAVKRGVEGGSQVRGGLLRPIVVF
jgi:hypothetical protein